MIPLPPDLIAGGIAATCGTIVTCPLEVIKTRLQASGEAFHPIQPNVWNLDSNRNVADHRSTIGCIRHMYRTEGFRSLFKGVGSTIVGAAPTRGIYFYVYAKVTKIIKTEWKNRGMNPDSWLVTSIAAGCASFTTHTCTTPLWFIKTRIQLNNAERNLSMWRVFWDVYHNEGFPAFYRGLSASYYGMIETIIYFVLYEQIKKLLREYPSSYLTGNKGENGLFDYFISACSSKAMASVFGYPHEVARTRLRQAVPPGQERRYQSFWQTLYLVYKESGVVHGLYSGFGPQMVRVLPNQAIIFMVYEELTSSSQFKNIFRV